MGDRIIAEQRVVLHTLEHLRRVLELRLSVLEQPPVGAARSPSHAGDDGPAGPVRDSGAARVAVRCLGPFQLEVAGRPVGSWPPGRARSLFQYLANRPNRPVPRDTLIAALWPDPDALAAGTSLKVAVHMLRQLLGQSHDDDAALAILARGAGYELAAADLWLDVNEFEDSCGRARRLEAQGRAAEATACHARAAELYRGDFLEDSCEEWVVVRREGLRDQYLLALAKLADAALAWGDYGGCIRWCQQLLEQDTCREDAYRTLMLCHARLGQRSRVQRWYELCVRTLRAELDVDPEPETEALHHRLMAGAPTERSAAAAINPTVTPA